LGRAGRSDTLASVTEEVVRSELRGQAAWLTIDREERRNALSPEVIDGLLEGLMLAAEDPAARVVVITGAGERAFCAGADLGGVAAAEGRVAEHDRRARLGDVLSGIVEHPKPVVARVNGHALAGGFGLALACDLIVAADSAEFGTPEVNIGLWPFMITAVIQRNVPRKIALEMMLTGRRMGAEEAERWGLVNRLVTGTELDGAVDELVQELASKSPLVLRLGKESFRRAQDMAFDDALAYLNAMLTVELESEDVVEGVSAFVQKRTPDWKGR
jgi:enoyl-CoA hydratase/carnithine racemase